ncbi:hypothetical protein CR194_04535 [Salipaludibacillus keqinensis]|uniref:histidine kinase n=1 Tax=Salipaludibacillus keqinensis TaxID=2045207 RepID=A0A323TJQ4_9BACI|nr:HAMP domain-containing sensor histidine kinase [Salipaludibacillus keqinensis]PYZ94800.1 hypothetical protein CR194_04535 [Salipaludibacillus keqinensis]
MMKTKTIFRKLLVSYSLIIFLSFVLFGLVFIYLFHLNLYDDYEDLFVYQQGQLEDQLGYSAEAGWTEQETESALQPALRHRDYSILVYHPDGERVFSPQDNRTDGRDPEREIIHTAASGEMVSEGGRFNGSLSYIIANRLQASEGEESYVAVMIFHDLDHQYRQMGLMILFPFIVTIAFAGVILYFMSRKITAPLRDMNDIALKLATGDFSRKVKVASEDEVGQLGETFNYMAEELNSLEEMRRDFLANVSHDLRSPLTSIKGFLVALLDGTIPEHKRDHYYWLMKEETERVIKLVNDTLDMSRLEAGQVEISPEPYNLTDQLHRIQVILEPQLERKGMILDIEPDAEAIFVTADRDRMDQVFVNLLQNAIQVSPKRGTVRVKLQKMNDEVAVSVLDEGKGIPEDQLDRIWERFYKVEKSRTNKGGAGIGLSIVKSIMDLHKLEIKVKSEPGKGTVFTFTLPLNQ